MDNIELVLNNLLDEYNSQIYLVATGLTITHYSIPYTNNARLKFIFNIMKNNGFCFDTLDKWRGCKPVSSKYFYGYIIDRKEWYHRFDKEIFESSIRYISHYTTCSEIKCLIEVDNKATTTNNPYIQLITTKEVEQWIKKI